ncbi:hypothetical protein IMSAG185_00974 [Lachnospiraceae bacterium]|nr:hypothetical protein IMSAG185_00974 [Lachnospiraceae bacterium]
MSDTDYPGSLFPCNFGCLQVVLGSTGVGYDKNQILLCGQGGGDCLHVGIGDAVYLLCNAQELVSGLLCRQQAVSHAEKIDMLRLLQQNYNTFKLRQVQQVKSFVYGADMGAADFFRQGIKYGIGDILTGRVCLGRFLAAQGKPHFKLLISLKLQASAEAVHAGVTHTAGVSQIRYGEVGNLVPVAEAVICNLLFCFGKFIVGGMDSFNHIYIVHIDSFPHLPGFYYLIIEI